MADKIICNKSELVDVADAVRSKLGVTNTYHISELSTAIESIPTGTQLPTLTNPGSTSDLLSGKELIDQDGNVVTGNIPTKTSSDLISSGATVTVPTGYYASSASKSVSTATQATPSISVSSSGLITASATQSAGYVSSGTKIQQKQLTTQAAKTVTPARSDVVAVESGKYTTGTVYVKGDNNLVADNIKSGTSIFGVTGSYEGSGGGDGGTMEGAYFSNISINMIINNIALNECNFYNCECYFNSSTNLSFTNCYFNNSYISCTAEIYAAIVNDGSNSYSSSSFDITS